MFNCWRKPKAHVKNNSVTELQIKDQDCRYLLNPYQQLSCWFLYRIYQPDMGERVRDLLLELKALVLEFDEYNKDKYSFSLDNWDPYNVWMDIVVSQYLNKYLGSVQERLFIKRQHPEKYVQFFSYISGLNRMMDEHYLIFKPAFPNEQAVKDYRGICEKISNLGNVLSYTGIDRGTYLHSVFYHLTDNKNREDLDNDYIFEEPKIYPTYIVYPEPYKVGDKIETEGVYLPDSVLKRIKMFAFNETDKFTHTDIHVSDIPKLGKPIREFRGKIEYGLFDDFDPYYKTEQELEEFHPSYEPSHIETDWYYVKEIPPNTEGVPNNPLRLEHLRYPLKDGEEYITLEQLKQRDGYVYQHPDAMVEQYFQVVNRYDKFYREYLLAHGVDPKRLRSYLQPKAE